MEPNTRLDEAICGKDLRMLKDALRRGADANLRIGAEGRSSLYWAVVSGEVGLVQALVQAGAKAGLEKGDSTSLHAAAEAGNLEMVRLVLKAGGKRLANRFDWLQRTPLMCAVERGSVEVVRELLDAGADVNAKEDARLSNTALRIATGEGTLEMVKVLVLAGADPMIPGRLMLTALDRARERRTPEGRLITAHLTRMLESVAAAVLARRKAQRGKARRRTGAGRGKASRRKR